MATTVNPKSKLDKAPVQRYSLVVRACHPKESLLFGKHFFNDKQLIEMLDGLRTADQFHTDRDYRLHRFDPQPFDKINC